MSAESWKWTTRRERAAQLVADDQLTDTEIALQCGVTQRQLERWKKVPEFQERVAAIVEAERQAILAKGIAEKRNRVDALNDRWQRMRQVIDERAEDPDMAKVPGGRTGLLVREFKQIGTGPDATMVEEFHLDAALLKESREHEKQAAQELGQWTEKRELTGKDGGPIEFRDRPDLSKLSDDELNNLERLLSKTTDPGRDPGRKGSA